MSLLTHADTRVVTAADPIREPGRPATYGGIPTTRIEGSSDPSGVSDFHPRTQCENRGLRASAIERYDNEQRGACTSPRGLQRRLRSVAGRWKVIAGDDRLRSQRSAAAGHHYVWAARRRSLGELLDGRVLFA